MKCSQTLIVSVLAGAIAIPGGTAAAQFKKQNRNAVADLEDGNVEEAIDAFKEQTEDPRGPEEAYYGLALCYGSLGKVRQAMDAVGQALDEGMPIQRFAAGPRVYLEDVVQSDAFQRLWDSEAESELLHGPQLGGVTDDQVIVWVRTRKEVPVRVTLSRESEMSSVARSVVGTTHASDDYTTTLKVTGLEPETRYWYRLTVDGSSLSEVCSFKTLPKLGSSTRFSIGFGGGAGYVPPNEGVWTQLASESFDAFFLLGDNVYIDHPKHPTVQKYCYYRRQSRSEFRRFVSQTPVFAIWDDHDFATNDSHGGPRIEKPSWKRDVWNVFRDNWMNPAFGGGPNIPGVWFSHRIADVEFFFLDGRYYREDPRQGKDTSMLGPIQKEWLLQSLAASGATFKVICTDVPMAHGVKPGSLDPWDGFPEEREEIFDFIAEEKIEGVFIIAADRHRSDAWRIELENAYDLYEFQSSRLTNEHVHPVLDGALFGTNRHSYGVLQFDTERDDPCVTYEIRDAQNGNVLHQFTLRRSELTIP